MAGLFRRERLERARRVLQVENVVAIVRAAEGADPMRGLQLMALWARPELRGAGVEMASSVVPPAARDLLLGQGSHNGLLEGGKGVSFGSPAVRNPASVDSA